MSRTIRDDEYGRRQRSNYHPRDPESETWADDFDEADSEDVDLTTEDEDDTPINTNS